jgi:hypothetical protein
MNEERAARTAAVLGAVAYGVLYYIRHKRIEEMKRARIGHWKETNNECIRNFRARMTKLAEDPTVDASTFWKAYHEEAQFLDIVTNQPMY